VKYLTSLLTLLVMSFSLSFISCDLSSDSKTNDTGTTTYTVTYNGNGNTGGNVPTDSSLYPADSTVIVLGNTGTLVKTNYTFAGWNTQADGGGTLYAPGGVFNIGTSNIILYAKWTLAIFTVTYDGNVNTGGTVPVDSANYQQGDTVTALGNTGTLTKTGYGFMGWNIQADGNGTTYTQYQTFSMGTGNVILYAKWQLAATLSMNITYSGTGTVDASHKIYVIVMYDQCSQLQIPLFTGMLETNTGTLMATGLVKSPVYVTVFYDIDGSAANCVGTFCNMPFLIQSALNNGDPFAIYNGTDGTGTSFSGTYTRPIPAPITLTAGSTKAITITFSNSGSPYYPYNSAFTNACP
jgi:uncharacterized repeat protein (TIGR02543 family)